jgi:hypothetical protein
MASNGTGIVPSWRIRYHEDETQESPQLWNLTNFVN